MADSRFFQNAGPKKLAELSALSGAALGPESDPDTVIADVAALDQAGPGHISFLDNIKYRDAFSNTRASACIVAPPMAEKAPKGVALLITETPYKAYALVARAFYPAPPPPPRIAERATIAGTAKIGEGSVVEEGAVIGAGVRIGARSWIGANTVIGNNVEIGADCRIGANATISHALIGDNVSIYPGCCIGQDGFGFAPDPAGHVKVPQLGRVVIGDNVEIGANTTIDRGAGPDTIIGQGTWIDNLVQIGHNVRIGRGCIVVAQVGISGSTVIGDFAVFGGQAGIAGHLSIGDGVRVGAQSGVMRDIGPGQEVVGSPALPKREFMRQITALNRLIQKKKNVNE